MGAGVSPQCDPSKSLAFQGSGFLICEIVKESQEQGSPDTLKEVPYKEKLLEHLFKEPSGDALEVGTQESVITDALAFPRL